MIKNINESIVYVGTDDHDIDLFEGMYDVPEFHTILMLY